MEQTFYTTWELRWFFKGELPKSVIAWFISKTERFNLEFSEPRTDHYLVFQNAITCGAKFREDNFEIKTFIENDKGYQNFTIQRWEKWSYGDEKSSIFNKKITEGNHWCEVQKSRMLLFFENDEGFREITEPNQTDYQTCQVEISKIKLNGTEWWGLNLECEDKMDSKEFLNQIAGWLLPDCPVTLEAKNAMSYPQWLYNNYKTNGTQ